MNTWQWLADIGFAVIILLLGALTKIMWSSITNLQKFSESLLKKLQQHEVKVAAECITRQECTIANHRIFEKLDRIEDKIDKKADK